MRFGLKDLDISRIQGVLKDFPNVQRAMIYGSRAMGTYKRGSDIDLALYGKSLNPDEIGRIRIQLDDLKSTYVSTVSLKEAVSSHS
ncbi:putative nucleotidyltransferase [Limihaloglobus sulfuriphilus]|uniref:Putative nucleotidyltransferase n=1 Tax=Limihaloglobus sulfuriphilus TaxID=1851148 RepID=A0A1Q2MEW7_9BACT|nr:nucleotidyltransferase domain-containing protein [Limihaloglobus sulfuriphilus]AQQ71199.1 putative nucleotidyltransferase [Limihaloglobus sulfuriphilus]